MNIADASRIVLELAQQNVIDDDEMAEERARQQEAIDTATLWFSHDQTHVVQRVGLDKFIRSALVVPQNKTQSFDLVDDEGNLICRINASHFGESNRANIEVIFGQVNHRARTLTFEGSCAHPVPVHDDVNLVAVEFNIPNEAGSYWT